MPLTVQQLELIEKYLYLDESDSDEPQATIKVSRRDLRFLVQAIQYYHDSCCPSVQEGSSCVGRVWGEDVHTGALEMSCNHSCQDWIAELLSPETLDQFSTRPAGA